MPLRAQQFAVCFFLGSLLELVLKEYPISNKEYPNDEGKAKYKRQS
jgi:hypothetical protein